MRSVKASAIAGAVALVSTAAIAADMPYQPPMPAPQPICVPRAQAYLWPGVPICLEEEFNNWYLRGDIGMSSQQLKGLDNLLYAGNSINAVGMGFDSAPFFGLGVGYNYNDWLRLDLTGEYRGRANFHGLDIINGGAYTDEYHASKSEWLFLANAYADLGTWWCVTPFLGAGVGFSRNTIHSFQDINTPLNGVAFGADQSKWNFAWALHAGFGVKVSQSTTLEFAYRYTSLGDATSGDLITYTGTNQFNNPMLFKGLTSHDFKVGVRFVCCDVSPALPLPPQQQVYYQPQPLQPPPTYVQPQPTYVQPQPTYVQPQPTYVQPQTYVPQPTYQPQYIPQQQPLMRKG
jgi:opacity protein-like surface antigen